MYTYIYIYIYMYIYIYIHRHMALQVNKTATSPLRRSGLKGEGAATIL